MSPLNLVFCNLQNSGASAIDPILATLLRRHGYTTTPAGPDGTHALREYVDQHPLLYHWSHSPPSDFETMGLLGRLDYRFVFLHRDPRDVAVSLLHDHRICGRLLDQNDRQGVLTVLLTQLPTFLKSAESWFSWARKRPDQCILLRFDEVKRDTLACIRRILDHIQLPLPDDEVRAAVEEYSFERIAQRKRGDEGPAVRNRYFVRKGISGEWIAHFDTEVSDITKDRIADYLVSAGWETDHAWGPHSYFLISAPFASGVTWLSNILLALDIRTTNWSFRGDHWRRLPDGTHEIGEAALNHLKWHHPILHRRTAFGFRENLEVVWEHRLDLAGREHPVLLFVRDPRDAIYSLYRRNYAEAMDLEAYLDRPDIWPQHFPDLFSLPPPETWALFHLYWLALGGQRLVRVIRFENAKRRPDETMAEVLQFLGVDRSAEEQALARESSSFANAQDAMKTMESTTGQRFLTARRGEPEEWRKTYAPNLLERFKGLVSLAMAALGYVPMETPRLEPAAFLRRVRNLEYPATVGEVIDAHWNAIANGQPESAIEDLEGRLHAPIQDPSLDDDVLAAILAVEQASKALRTQPREGVVLRALVSVLFHSYRLHTDTPAIRVILKSRHIKTLERLAGQYKELSDQGKALLRQGRAEDATRLYESIARRFPRQPLGFFGLACLQPEQGGEAHVQLLEKAHSLNPKDPVVLSALQAARQKASTRG